MIYYKQRSKCTISINIVSYIIYLFVIPLYHFQILVTQEKNKLKKKKKKKKERKYNRNKI